MRLAAALAAGCLLAVPAFALEFRAVKENAILYDAPSTKGGKYLIAARGTPVEIILTQGAWTKVRESGGNMAWIESGLLAKEQTVLVRVEKADIRASADMKSTTVFSAEKNVVLELLEKNPPGWAKVRHHDAQGNELSGFVKASQVWGL